MSEARVYTDFDTWFSEQEGFSIRAERFDGDVEWLRAAFEAGRASTAASSSEWKLVPVEPTQEMMAAMGDAIFDAAIGHVAGDLASVNEPFRRFYRAMLSASPAPPEGGEPVAWHWWASDKSSTWPVWSLGPERPANAPGAIPLYAHPSPDTGALREAEQLTAYELQVLVGTTISGCNMSPDPLFNLEAARARLHGLGMVDRTDGLAIATDKGRARVDAALSTPPRGKP